MVDMNTFAVRNVYSKNCVEGPFASFSCLITVVHHAQSHSVHLAHIHRTCELFSVLTDF